MNINSFILIVLGLLFSANLFSKSLLLKDFDNQNGLIKLSPQAIVSADKKQITIQPPKHSKSIDYIVLDGKILNPSTTYTISFDVELFHIPSIENYLEITLMDYASKIRYCQRRYTIDFTCNKKRINYTFTTTTNSNNMLKLAAHGVPNAIIKNFELYEGSNEQFLHISNNTTEQKKSPTITGSKEFEVLQPSTTKSIVNALDFGVSPSALDNTDALNKAIEHCKKIGASKLVIEKGIYYMTKEKPIILSGLSNFTIEGSGSTLVYNKKYSNNMVVKDCKQVKIQNLNMDWDWQKDPLAAVVEVIEKARQDEMGYVVLKFIHYEDYPVKNFYVANFTAWDINTNTIGMENGQPIAFLFNNTAKPTYYLKHKIVEWLKPNVVKLQITKEKLAHFTQKYYRLQHKYYHMGGINITNNQHLTFENFNIYSCAGQAMLVRGATKYLWLKNVKITVPEGDKKRVISSTADHFILAQSSGYIKLENCDFGHGSDDCINIHDNTIFVERSSDTTLRTLRKRNDYIYQVGEEIEILNSDYSPTNYIGKVIALKPINIKKGIFDIVFDKPLPQAKFEGFILLNKKYGTKNVIIRNCKFHNNRARGVLILCKNVTIENCHFERNEMGSIKIETGYTLNLWAEGYGVKNILIRNNTFDSCNVLGTSNFGYERDIFIGAYARRDPSEAIIEEPIISDILFENNTFKNTFGLIATISSAHNITFNNNKIINTIKRDNPKHYRGGFYITDCKNIVVSNNKYEKSDTLDYKSIGVITNCANQINIYDNQVE